MEEALRKKERERAREEQREVEDQRENMESEIALLKKEKRRLMENLDL